MSTSRKFLGGPLLLAALIVALLAPAQISAAPSSGHASVALATKPERPVAGVETRLTITLQDRNQQVLAGALVQVRAEMVMAGMAGMQHGNVLTLTAKQSDKPGEYVGSIKLPNEGDWKITIVAGDSVAEFKVTANKAQATLATGANSSVESARASAWVKVASPTLNASSMEAVHASYLELTGNIADVRSRVDLWKKGDAESQRIGDEQLERIRVVLGSVTWPDVMAKAVISVASALDSMTLAFEAKDVAAAELASKPLGDGAHDVTHAFYGDWLPAVEGVRFSPMAPHAIYLDLNANIADLLDRVDQWRKGDESSLNIATEKAQRIDVLLPHLRPSGMMLRPASAIEKALPTVAKAMERKDVAGAQEALWPIVEASHDLTHFFYAWMGISAGGNDAACVLASYRDLSLNITDLQARVHQWQQGDEDGYKIAQERLERVELILAHPAWPAAMSTPIGKTEAAVKAMAKALNEESLAGAESAAKAFGDSSRDVAHEYFGVWLRSSNLGSDEGLVATAQGGTVTKGHSDSHGSAAEGSSGPNYYFVGSILGIVLLTIAMVPVLRRHELRAQPVEAD